MKEQVITEHGRILTYWNIPEFVKREHTTGWYIGASVAGLGLLVWALVSRNFLFAIIILIIAVILYRQELHDPVMLRFAVSEDGIHIAEQKFFPFKDIRNFWIIYEPPKIKSLIFTFKAPLRPDLIIPLEKENPVDVRNVLLNYLPEDLEQENEPPSEAIGRALKI